MPVSKETIAADYPLPVYNYRVEIAGNAVAFSEVSGLSISHEVNTYKESQTASGVPGPRVFHVPGQRAPIKVTLKKGIVRGASLKQLYGWMRTVELNRVDKRDVSIRLCDEKGEAVVSWKMINAFPTKLDAPTFDAKSQDPAIETMELTADYVSLEET
ncbi:MAG TPA: phage tail protein [Polyangiaceae bacterium]|nr:phage tail protein [Polyangiaceae bacterium]